MIINDKGGEKFPKIIKRGKNYKDKKDRERYLTKEGDQLKFEPHK